MVKKAMIMAAGVGTRLDPLTKRVPKPLVPVANTPIIELILKHLKKFGVNDVVANTHFLAESIHEQYGDNNLGINFNYVYEDKLSGTAGGVKKCEWFFDKGETFVVVSGDALTDVNIEELIKKHKETGALATMALRQVPMSEVSHFGVVVTDENSRVIGFQEKPAIEEAKSNLVNTGIYVFETDIFKYIPENTFYDFAKNVFPAIMADNKPLYAHIVDEYWNDIGTINQYRLSSFDIMNQRLNIDIPYPESEAGWHSDNAIISPNINIEGKIIVGDNTIINSNTRFFGNCIIGNNCIIEEGSQIRNSIIWDNVIIEKNSRLDGCIVANNAKIGKNCIITPGSIIPDSCTIEHNEKIFEEIKLQPDEKYSTKLELNAVKV